MGVSASEIVYFSDLSFYTSRMCILGGAKICSEKTQLIKTWESWQEQKAVQSCWRQKKQLAFVKPDLYAYLS